MRKRIPKSLRIAIPAVFILLIVLVASVLIVFSVQLGGQVRVQAEQNMRSVLRAVGINLQEEMDQLEEYMADVSTNNTVFRNLGSEQDMTRVYFAADEISKTFAPIINTNAAISGMLVYSANVDVFHAAYGELWGETGAQRVQLKAGIRSTIPAALTGGQLPMNEWSVITVDGRYFLCRAVNWREIYCACLLDVEKLARLLEQKYAIGGELVFTYGGQALSTTAGGGMGGAGSLVVEETVGNLGLVCVAPYDGVLRLTLLQGLLLVLSILAIVALPLLYVYLHRSFIRPMNELVHSMQQIQAGDLKARPSGKYTSREFQQVNDTFNTMIGQIEDLKIEGYEQQLAAERNEMMALKMQIKPHFFLNCLKSLYALAAAGNTAKVQSLILLLSKHLRYVLSFREDTVPLGTELELCQNYVELHGVGRAMAAVCRVAADARLDELPVPVVSLLTLVENSVKHADGVAQPLKIWLEAHRLDMEGGALANLTIYDNGGGFTGAQLAALNRELPKVQEDKNHVGIANVIRRFRLLYGEGFAATFSNRAGGGAQVDLYIPLEGAAGDETADCG